ncbi:class I SAM-dependent methyltransferase [Candidatus Gottesmanbacteria bacterium]|nr:class I SAM-dependent methyltransferase [Candidatus Gottesmanbacteria bacterium]
MNVLDLLDPHTITAKHTIGRFIRHFARQDNWHNLDISTANLGYGWIHYALIRVLQPKRILCVGSKYGFIPAMCALACKDNKGGVVDFVDAGFDQTNAHHNSLLGAQKNVHWGGVGFWTKANASKHFDVFGLAPYVKLHLTTSEMFANHSHSQTWGYTHIDGNHSYEGVRGDFARFWPLLAAGGFMVFHDIYTKNLGGLSYGVSRFWREITKKKMYNAISLPGDCGVGLLQKPYSLPL